MTLFFVVTGALVLWVNGHKPRLLILHSYDTDYVWTREVDEGIRRGLGSGAWITVRRHYMRTKKFSDAPSLRRAAAAARKAVEDFRPDVILAVDDYAQKLVGRYYAGRPGISVVFAGVNGDPAVYGYDRAANVTGILERKQTAALREVLSMLARDRSRALRIAYLSDPALSSRCDVDTARRCDWSPHEMVGCFIVADFGRWRRKVRELAGRIDFLLVSGYRKLPRRAGRNDFVPPREVMAWTTEHIGVPVIGMNVFNSRDGAMLSVGVSPYEQGGVAARMALDILSGRKKAADIPVRSASQYVVSMSQSALRRYDIEVPRVFEAFARATDNYYP
jgi:hypothetical protein